MTTYKFKVGDAVRLDGDYIDRMHLPSLPMIACMAFTGTVTIAQHPNYQVKWNGAPGSGMSYLRTHLFDEIELI